MSDDKTSNNEQNKKTDEISPEELEKVAGGMMLDGIIRSAQKAINTVSQVTFQNQATNGVDANGKATTTTDTTYD